MNSLAWPLNLFCQGGRQVVHTTWQQTVQDFCYIWEFIIRLNWDGDRDFLGKSGLGTGTGTGSLE